MFLVGLHIFPKFELAMGMEVRPAVENNLSRALGGGDPALYWEHITPENTRIYHLYHQ